VAVAVADKLDTIASFFIYNEKPTGSKDPFALRRAALGLLALTQTNLLRLKAIEAFDLIRTALFEQRSDAHLIVSTKFVERQADRTAIEVIEFFADRLKVQQREAGVRHDLIDAVFALGGEDDFVRLLARVHALQAFMGGDDGANLLAGYKRAANILKKEGTAAPQDRHPGLDPGSSSTGGMAQGAEGSGTPGQARSDGGREPEAVRIPADGEEDPFAMVDDPDIAYAMRERIAVHKALFYTPDPDEGALIAALDTAEPLAAEAVAAEDFAAAMAALAQLRGPIDAFFTTVTVNDADPAKRAGRLALLARFRDAVHRVADFSRIEG
jgi:glycyl-tRNA synthetase beta chain